MSRNLGELQAECAKYGLTVTQECKREGKAAYEKALRDFIWNRDNPGQEMPEQIQPMLARNCKDITAKEVDEMFRDGSQWVEQEKINGCRTVTRFRNPAKGRINHILSRRLSDETYRQNELHDQMPHYRDLCLGDEWEDTVIDGEVLAPNPVVDTSFVDGKGVKTLDILQATAAIMNCDPIKSIAIQQKYGKLVIHTFDCLRFKGRDVRDLPYVVLTKDGLDIDRTQESRYVFLEQVMARITEVLGELPCQHCSGVRFIEEPAPEPKSMVEQEDFTALLDG